MIKIEIVKNGMSIKKVIESMILDRLEWPNKIHVANLD